MTLFFASWSWPQSWGRLMRWFPAFRLRFNTLGRTLTKIYIFWGNTWYNQNHVKKHIYICKPGKTKTMWLNTYLYMNLFLYMHIFGKDVIRKYVFFRSTRLSLINLQVEPTRAKGQQAWEVMPRSICCEKIAQPNKGGSNISWESQGVATCLVFGLISPGRVSRHRGGGAPLDLHVK